MFVGLGKMATGADLEALMWFRRSLEANQNHALAHFHFAAAQGLTGDLKEARSAAQAGLGREAINLPGGLLLAWVRYTLTATEMLRCREMTLTAANTELEL